jgi:hypothetical protein
MHAIDGVRGAVTVRAAIDGFAIDRAISVGELRSRSIPSHRAGPDLDSYGNCGGRMGAGVRVSSRLGISRTDRADPSIAIIEQVICLPTPYGPPLVHLRTTVCAVRVIEATELLALDVFNTGRRQITLGDVGRYLGQLRNHSPECACGRCQAARTLASCTFARRLRVPPQRGPQGCSR